MEQEDEEFEKLLGEIPRATSAPPHLEELQRAQLDDRLCCSVKDDTVKPFSDIRCDELYEDFYRTYSGAKKLPPPMENRSIYSDLVLSPKSASNQVSPFYNGLTLDGPHTSYHIQQLDMQQNQQTLLQSQRSQESFEQQQEQQQRKQQQSCASGLINHFSKLQSGQVLCDDESLPSAFANLNFEDNSGLKTGARARMEGGSRIADLNRDFTTVLSSGCATAVSSGIYSHLNSFDGASCGFGSASGATLHSFIPSSLPSLNPFSQNVTISRNSLNNGFSTGLDELSPVPVGQSMGKFFRQGSSDVDLRLNERSSSMDVHNRGFLSSSSFHEEQHQSSSAYNAAVALQTGLQYPIESAAPGSLITRSVGEQMQYPLHVEMASFFHAQQRMQVAAAASISEQQVEEERACYRQRMQQQLLFRQQQLQEQQARFYATLQAQPESMVSTYNKAHVMDQPVQYSSFNPALTINFLQQQPLQKQRQIEGFTFDEESRNHQLTGSLAAAVIGISEPTSQFSNICRYYAQGFCSRGGICPFLHVQTEGGMPRSNPAPLDGGLIVPSSELQSYHEKNIARKNSRGGQGVPSVISSSARRKDILVNGHSNGHTFSDGNLLINQNHSGGCADLKNKTNTRLNAQEHLETELSWSPNLQQSQPKYTTLEEVQGHIYSIAKDQHGCRFLQRKFEEGAVDDIHKVFLEIIDHIIELMTDPFGNYLVQKLLEVCEDCQRMAILQRVTGKGQLVTISLNMHGTRAVQKLIETLNSPVQVSMVICSLKQGVVTLIKDLNGNHVVQRCLQRLSTDDSQFIFDAVTSHCVEIATHRHGCCVLQRCVDFASGAQRECLVAEIALNALVLSQDSFGNYVVQYVLDLAIPWAIVEVISRMDGNFAHLAMQKFSSNVVEKCLKLAGEENKGQIIRELMNSSHLGQLLQDPYANYVIQSALSNSKGTLHASLVEAIRPHLSALRSSPYGKRILSRTNIKKNFGGLDITTRTSSS